MSHLVSNTHTQSPSMHKTTPTTRVPLYELSAVPDFPRSQAVREREVQQNQRKHDLHFNKEIKESCPSLLRAMHTLEHEKSSNHKVSTNATNSAASDHIPVKDPSTSVCPLELLLAAHDASSRTHSPVKEEASSLFTRSHSTASSQAASTTTSPTTSTHTSPSKSVSRPSHLSSNVRRASLPSHVSARRGLLSGQGLTQRQASTPLLTPTPPAVPLILASRRSSHDGAVASASTSTTSAGASPSSSIEADTATSSSAVTVPLIVHAPSTSVLSPHVHRRNSMPTLQVSSPPTLQPSTSSSTSSLTTLTSPLPPPHQRIKHAITPPPSTPEQTTPSSASSSSSSHASPSSTALPPAPRRRRSDDHPVAPRPPVTLSVQHSHSDALIGTHASSQQRDVDANTTTTSASTPSLHANVDGHLPPSNKIKLKSLKHHMKQKPVKPTEEVKTRDDEDDDINSSDDEHVNSETESCENGENPRNKPLLLRPSTAVPTGRGALSRTHLAHRQLKQSTGQSATATTSSTSSTSSITHSQARPVSSYTRPSSSYKQLQDHSSVVTSIFHDELQDETNKLKQLIKVYNSLKYQNEQYVQELLTLNKEMNTNDLQLQQHQQNKSENDKKLNELQSEWDELTAQHSKITQENDSITNEISTAQREKITNEKNLQNIKSESSIIDIKLDSIQKRINDVEKQQEEYMNEKEKIAKNIEKMKTKYDEELKQQTYYVESLEILRRKKQERELKYLESEQDASELFSSPLSPSSCTSPTHGNAATAEQHKLTLWTLRMNEVQRQTGSDNFLHITNKLMNQQQESDDMNKKKTDLEAKKEHVQKEQIALVQILSMKRLAAKNQPCDVSPSPCKTVHQAVQPISDALPCVDRMCDESKEVMHEADNNQSSQPSTSQLLATIQSVYSKLCSISSHVSRSLPSHSSSASSSSTTTLPLSLLSTWPSHIKAVLETLQQQNALMQAQQHTNKHAQESADRQPQQPADDEYDDEQQEYVEQSQTTITQDILQVNHDMKHDAQPHSIDSSVQDTVIVPQSQDVLDISSSTHSINSSINDDNHTVIPSVDDADEFEPSSVVSSDSDDSDLEEYVDDTIPENDI